MAQRILVWCSTVTVVYAYVGGHRYFAQILLLCSDNNSMLHLLLCCFLTTSWRILDHMVPIAYMCMFTLCSSTFNHILCYVLQSLDQWGP